MMISFEGRYKSKRQPPYIVESKGLIHQKQEERRVRARQCYEEKSAIRIQAFVRGSLCRRHLNIFLYEQFREIAKSISNSPANYAEDPQYVRSLCTCLRSFKLIGAKHVNEKDIVTISNVLLTPSCQKLLSKLFEANQHHLLHTITHVISHILTYLRQLPLMVPSKAYVNPIRVLELYLRSNSEQASQSLQRFSLALCQRGRFYYSLAIFIDRQSFSFESDNEDDVLGDFFRQPKNRAMLELLQLPLKHCLPKDASQGYLEPITQEFLTIALMDVAAAAATSSVNPSADSNGFAQSKIPRLIFPALLKAIPSELLIGQLYSAAINGSSDTHSIQPSLTLLHHFLCEIVPSLIRLSPPPSLQNAEPQQEDEDETVVFLLQQQQLWTPPFTEDSSVVLAVLRILRWMFSSLVAARCPVSPEENPFSPPFPTAPLKHTGMQDLDQFDVDDDDDDDEEDQARQRRSSMGREEQESSAGSEAFKRFANVWSTQTSEVFASLQKCLPTLASIALGELYSSTTSSISTNSQHTEIVLCLSTLHSMLSFVRSASAASLIPLNSVLSLCPGFLRDLWYLTQDFVAVRESDPTPSGHTWSPSVKFFDLLAAGDVVSLPANIDQYTAILLTFTDCLRHRLLCLTDVEINGDPACSLPESYGFSASELLQIGTRLRDLMIGLIALAYPYNRPNMTFTGSTAIGIEDVLARFQARNDIPRGQLNAPHTSTITSFSATNRMRWLLHRWSAMFRCSQALVTLIYDWDHRQQSRETAYLTRRKFDESSSDSEASVWLKPSALPAFRVEKLPLWLKTIASTGKHSVLAGAPFGYYSHLNPDLDVQAALGMTFMDWRQMTILMEMPFVITFWQRVNIFEALIYSGRRYIQNAPTPSLGWVPEDPIDRVPPVRVRVRRGYVYDDAFANCSKENAPSLLPRLYVTFYNQADVLEMGVDGGGLSREFLTQVLTEGFNPTRGFFLFTEDNTLYPNPNAEAVSPTDYLKHFYFLGRILAKAIYEGMLVELRFAHFFLAKLVTRTGGLGVGFDYLRSLDQELYRQLCKLKTYDGNVRDLELDFTTVQSTLGQSKVIELKPGGSSIPVTNASRVEYVHLVANYKLNRQIYRQSKAFIAGMTDVISLDWFRLFDAEELQVLISGADADIDVEDLRNNTKYVGDMTNHQNKVTIEIFWQTVASLSQDQKQALLRFVTACSRPPMFGFQDLLPAFTIQLVPGTDRLPTASTCMNLLKLPVYQDPEVLATKLLYALNANAGFEYS